MFNTNRHVNPMIHTHNFARDTRKGLENFCTERLKIVWKTKKRIEML